MQLTSKQQEYIINANKRWNIKTGAVRSGKSFVDVAYVIARRIRDRIGVPGIVVILGVSKESIERNVLQPMREIYTSDVVSTINSRNIARVCGETVYCLGAAKVTQVAQIQGASIKYCYGDEIAKWHPDVFQILKSRLDKECSCFDGSANPEDPNHWLKTFIDSDGIDLYLQTYTLFDNKFLPDFYVENLCREYRGTVFYDRLILGLWTAAEGVIYRQFADDEEEFLVHVDEEYLQDVDFVSIGIDFGGTRSLTTFVATAIHKKCSKLTVLADYHIQGKKGDIDATRLCEEFIAFLQRLKKHYPSVYIRYVYADSEAQYLINSLRKSIDERGRRITIADSAKYSIKQRIIASNTLLNTGRLFIDESCHLVRSGLKAAIWDPRKADTRLDNFSTDIDIIDAFEYSWERFIIKSNIVFNPVAGGI